MRRLLCPLLALGLGLSACATVPTGPDVMVLPGTGKSFGQFQADDASCRSWAALQTGTSRERAATRSGVAAAAVGTAVGAAAGAAIGGAAGSAGAGAAIGAGSGLLLGSAVGADRAWGAESTIQRRYDTAYMQCMYANGNRIPVPGGAATGYLPRSASRSVPPPPPRSAPLPPGVPPPPAGPPPPPPPGLR